MWKFHWTGKRGKQKKKIYLTSTPGSDQEEMHRLLRVTRTLFTYRNGERKTFFLQHRAHKKRRCINHTGKAKNKAKTVQKEMRKCKTTEMNKVNSLSCHKENGKCPA